MTNTVESYLGRLKLFLKYFNDRPIKKVDETEMREYLPVFVGLRA